MVPRALYRQPRGLRPARARGARQLHAPRHRPHAGRSTWPKRASRRSASARASRSSMPRASAASSSCTSSRDRCWCRRALPVGIVTGIRGNLRYRDCHVDRPLRPCRRRAARNAAGRRAGRRSSSCIGSKPLWIAHEAAGKDLVCTVGRFHTDTDVHTMTKIPGEVWFSLDIRSEDNAVLLALDRELRRMAEEIGMRRGVGIDLGPSPTPCPDRSTRRIATGSSCWRARSASRQSRWPAEPGTMRQCSPIAACRRP